MAEKASAGRKTSEPASKKFEERDWDDISSIRRSQAKAAAPKEEAKEALEAAEAEPEAPKKMKVETGQAEAILEEMKAQGVPGAIVRADGIIIHSTLPISDAAAGMLASASNVTDALMKRSGDVPREIEMTFGTAIFVVIPIGIHLFCGSVKSREQKKTIREFAERARKVL